MVGECQLTFTDDFYAKVEQRLPVDFKLLSTPSMHDVYSKEVLHVLRQYGIAL